jgi:putative spermidine/putrescine transport system permease protein
VPAALLVAAAYVLPIARLLVISVTEPAPGLGNYVFLLTSPAIRRVVITTVRVAGTTSICALLLGYLLAYAMVMLPPRRQRLLLFALLVPFWLSVLVRSFAWITLLRSQGLINGALVGWGVIDQPLRLVYNELGVMIGMVHYMTPYAVFVLYAHMQSIDRRLCDAARGLGASPGHVFWRVWLPLSLPGVAAAAILIFIFSLGFYVTPTLLGAGKTVMVAEYINVQVSQTLRWGIATALATMLLFTVGLLVWLLGRVADLDRLFGAART